MAHPEQPEFDIYPNMEEVLSGSFNAYGRLVTINEIIRETVGDTDGTALEKMLNDRHPVMGLPSWAPGLTCDVILEEGVGEHGQRLVMPERLFMTFDEVDAAAGEARQLQIYRRHQAVGSTKIGQLFIGHKRKPEGIDIGIGIQDNFRVQDLRNHRAQITEIAEAFLNHDHDPSKLGY
ncbi:MAG: hypothetical protein JWO47_128 [Candidatus Saccharibacteria bacterium]|nr:hypothetical protein [Candidatus Saccharibacteria bacterium]